MKDEEKTKENNEINTNEDIVLDDIEIIDSTEDGEALPTKDILKKLREEIKSLKKEKEEYLTGWQRAKADYINLQKELEQVRISVSILSKEKMTEKLFPVLDSFEMAFANKEHWNTLEKEWRDGIMSIYQQFLSGLKDSGIEKIDQAEVLFDPNIHQSISIIETTDESKDHTVEKILQTGYRIGEKVIRPARVTIYQLRK